MQRAWDFLARRKANLDMLQWQFDIAPFSHSYTINQLVDLDTNYTGRRTALDAIADVYSLAERLRIIGRVIDSAGGQLITPTKNLDSVSFRYSDCEGDIRNAEYNAIELYRLQQEFYSGRRVMPHTDFTHAPLQSEDEAA